MYQFYLTASFYKEAVFTYHTLSTLLFADPLELKPYNALTLIEKPDIRQATPTRPTIRYQKR